MKRLEFVQLFTDAGKLDRLAGHGLHAQRRTTARVTVELGENGPGDVQRLIEVRGDIHSFLAGGGIEHQQNFLRLDEVAQPHELLHERLVNLQPTGGVENNDVAIVQLRERKRFLGNFQHVRFAAFYKKDRKSVV